MCMSKCVRSCVRVYVCLMEFSSPLALGGRSRLRVLAQLKALSQGIPLSTLTSCPAHLFPLGERRQGLCTKIQGEIHIPKHLQSV